VGGVSGSVQNGPKRWHTTRAQNSVSGTPQGMHYAWRQLPASDNAGWACIMPGASCPPQIRQVGHALCLASAARLR